MRAYLPERLPTPFLCPAVSLVETRWGVMLVSMYDVYIGRSLFLYGEWSPGEGDLYGFLIKPGDFVADVGAVRRG